MKTVRFAKLVEALGKPEPYTLWLPPEKDRHLQAAIKAHRVMTVHQEKTGTKDFGEVGFNQDVQGSFLVFPKSLKRYEGRRVVGIKYDLLEQPPAFAEAPATKRERQPAARPKPAPPPVQPAPNFQPLRVFQPDEPEEQPKPAKAKPAPVEKESRELTALTREVRKAMKKLEQGNAVAAYQLLQKAVRAK